MGVIYNRKIFYDYVRNPLFYGSLSQGQVDGMDAILTEWEINEGLIDQRWLAYMLATTIHETASTMQPIEEYGKGSGKTYGQKDPETGQTYYGRGYVQLTWRDNYARATEKLGLTGDDDIEWHAAGALDPIIASNVMFRGMVEGWFTGKKLDQYFNDTKNDPKNARQIINGNDKDTTIAGYHDIFLKALYAAAEEVVEPLPPPLLEIPIVTVTLSSDSPVSIQIVVGANIESCELI